MASRIERARASLSRLRDKFRTQEPLRALSAFGMGATIGTLERTGVLPPTIAGMPAKPLIATALYAIGATSRQTSTISSFALGGGSGVIGAYGYAAGKAGTLIAGEDGVPMLGAGSADELELEEEEIELND